jgi:hypothetical protein
MTYYEVDDNTDVRTCHTEDEVYAIAEGIAEARSLWGGVWITGTEIWGHCDEECCDVCDGHLIGYVRKYEEDDTAVRAALAYLAARKV